MKVRVQMCYCGNDKFVVRALVCGGLRVLAPDGKWTRKVATDLLDILETHFPLVSRRNIRFTHV